MGGQVSRRHWVQGAFAASAMSLAACSSDKGASSASATASHSSSSSHPSTPSSTTPAGTPIGDGSTSNTGPQPHQPKPQRLKPGEKPPQFVVISWDGAGEITSWGLLERFRKVAQETHASMTLFLSGIYMLRASEHMRYNPPQHRRGSSDINFLDDEDLRSTIKGIGEAWREGHEIGTHFNGHFCGPTGVSRWSVADWKSEIAQAKEFVKTWRTTSGMTDLPSLPFDYDKELVGARTPCLEGPKNLRLAASELGWRYDSSGTANQMWPTKDHGLWDLSLQSIPLAGTRTSVLSMDYNFLMMQSRTTRGDRAMYPTWREQTYNSYLEAFERSYHGNRAPLVIGNHFEQWNGGIYMDAVEQFMRKVATYSDAKMVSFRQLCDWLDAQTPQTISALQSLPMGSAPAGGWSALR